MKIPFLDLAAMHAELAPEIDAAWRKVSESGRFVGGPLVETFEAEWAAYCGTRHCVGVASGTAALELTLAALGIGRGAEVIIPANTFIASAAAVAAVGATPVFADVDPATLLLTADSIRPNLTPRTAAVMVVHLYGQPADMDAINALASRAGICVIEDAAQAHGATWQGRPAGGLSNAGCFSFYPGKNLGAFGDAGAVVTNDAALAERIRAMSNHGRCHDDPYRHDMLGGNHRLDALQAAVLSVKLRRLDAWNAARRHAASLYEAALADLPATMVATAQAASSSHHLAVIRTPNRDALREALTAAGIGTGIHYPIPCHLQAPFLSSGRRAMPVTEQAAGEILSLPLYPHITEAEILHVAGTIAEFLAAPRIRLAGVY
jgi:dTDP-4-amino-4,6-dideoxygalactose transaminase